MQLNELDIDWGGVFSTVTDVGAKVYKATQESKALKAQRTAELQAQAAAQAAANRAMEARLSQPSPFGNLASMLPVLLIAGGGAFFFFRKKRRH
jgi:hypothetical protein